jgi:hypothetical protein
VEGRRTHDFTCAATNCKGRGKDPRLVRRYLDTKDKASTGSLRAHATRCWGKEIVQSASAAKDIASARQALGKAEMRDGSLTAVFERSGKGKITYSHVSHTRDETRAEIVKWVSESMRPLSVVEDDGFRKLMKTGRPEHYIPSRRTVARDVNQVFKKTRKRIAKMLQVRSIQVQKQFIVETYTGSRWGVALRNGCLDFPKP